MFKFVSRLNQDNRAQSVVEFALVLFPLMLIVLGIVEFGWLFNGQLTITSSAREGVRVAAVSGTNSQIASAIERHVQGAGYTFDSLYDSEAQLQSASLDDGEVSAAVVYGSEDVTIFVRGKLEPLVGLFITGSKDLWGHAVMRQE